MTPDATITRSPSSDQGTFGVLVAGALVLKVAELPWRDNAQQFSCIPPGLYQCKWVKSPKFGWVYQVTEVPGRGNILIHSGNYVGDSTLGFKTHSHGCILPCKRLGAIGGQRAGLLSRPAVDAIAHHFNKQPFTLEIKNA